MDDLWDLLAEAEEFDWDQGNAPKLWERHEVTPGEAEQVFFNRPLLAAPDVGHSQGEARYYALGRTDEGRPLFLVFTLREKRIRVISARNMSRRERREYGRVQKES